MCFFIDVWIPLVGLVFWLCGSLTSFIVAVNIVTGAGLYAPPVALGIVMVVLLTLPLLCLVVWWVVAHLQWVD